MIERVLIGCCLGLSVLGGPAPADLDGSVAARDVAAFIENDSIRIGYWELGSGEALLLVHGLAGSADFWRELAPLEVLSRRWRIIALDLRGHGGSAKPLEPDSYGRKMAWDVVALLDSLGIEKAHVLGYSYGGLIVGELLANHPDRLSSAILGGCSRQDPERPEDLAWSEQFAEALESGLGAEWLAAALGGEDSDTDGEQRRAIESRIGGNDPEVMAAVLRATRDLTVSNEALESNSIPILALVGEHDPNLPEVMEMARITPHMEAVAIPGASHAAAPRSGEFWELVQEFLRAVGDGPGE